MKRTGSADETSDPGSGTLLPVAVSGAATPTLFIGVDARKRMRDFFSSHIRNPNTRRAYREAVRQFSGFCAEHGIVDLAQVEPIHVAAFVELQLKTQSKPTVKLRLVSTTGPAVSA